MAHGTFATVITCIDGRAAQPVEGWLKRHLLVNFVDFITEPGPDKTLTQGTAEQLAEIKRKVGISVSAHHSVTVAFAAHYDCAGNPVSDKEHQEQIAQATAIIAQWGLSINRVIGLWVNKEWEIEVVTDTAYELAKAS